MVRGLAFQVAALSLLMISPLRAETAEDRFAAAGYFRIMTRPDFQGGDSRLGFWNLYGRLLNEGPYAMLELRLALLPEDPATSRTWTRVSARIEGGSVANLDPAVANLSGFRLSQLYVQAGNVLLEHVTWQLGTLEYYFGDLGLYDFRPAIVFEDTVGLSGRYRWNRVDLLLGAGDAGFSLRGTDYSTILTAGGTLRLQLSSHLEVGAGGQLYGEPEVAGNRFAPYTTPGISYEDLVRGEVAQRFLEENPGMEAFFPRPQARSSSSFKAIGYLGFGQLGPLLWNNLFVRYRRLHPDNVVTETFEGRSYDIYVRDYTDERFQLDVGNEMQLRLVPQTLDLVWAAYYGRYRNRDNDILAGEDNRTFYSAVARLQLYLTETTHLLAESSAAREISIRGNLFRNHVDSVFESTGGVADPRGLETGDSDRRDTWQGKFGWVLSPLGTGIYTRPSLRILYGVQYSTQNNAFGNNFVDSLDDFNVFPNQEQHWHHVLALEAETWF